MFSYGPPSTPILLCLHFICHNLLWQALHVFVTHFSSLAPCFDIFEWRCGRIRHLHRSFKNGQWLKIPRIIDQDRECFSHSISLHRSIVSPSTWLFLVRVLDLRHKVRYYIRSENLLVHRCCSLSTWMIAPDEETHLEDREVHNGVYDVYKSVLNDAEWAIYDPIWQPLRVGFGILCVDSLKWLESWVGETKKINDESRSPQQCKNK